MYLDNPPVANAPVESVLVIESDDHDADEVISAAEGAATSEDGDGDRIFWVVFAEEPARMWDMTESVLRSEMRKRSRQ